MTAQGSVREQQRRERLSARERRVARADRREREAPVARAAILNAAEEIFARDGFDGARVDAIAEASGYNKALIFHYFGDKLGLYSEIVCMQRDESEFQRTEMLLTAAGNPETPMDAGHVRGFIETFVGWHFDHLVAHPHLRRIMAWEAAEGWGTLIEAKRGTGQACPVWVKPIAEFIGRAQAASLIRKDVDPYVAMAHVKSMVLIHLLSLPNYEALFGGVDFSSPQALEHARDQLISFAIHALMDPATLARQQEGSP
ncbi:MAG TPA: TetR family transcriptional regulator [Ktedonobacterales bacterium]|jgi:AcrR family transcriptional regulator